MAWTALSPAAWAQSLSFEQAQTLALRDTPALRANTAQLDAARAARTAADALPDPKLALGIDNLPTQGPDRYSLTRDAMTMQRISVMQDIPNGAKRAARAAAAQGRIALATAQIRLTRLLVLRETANAWLARDTAERQLARLDALAAENALLAAAVRAQIAGGKGAATDAVLPRQEAAQLDERRDELNARRRQAIATLTRWLGPAGEAPLAGPAPEWPLTRETLAPALHRHPELALFTPKAQVLDAEIAEAQAAKRPDWGVDLAYQRRAPEFGDMVSVQVRFDLPLFPGSRQDPQIAARQAERAAIDAERDATLREHRAALDADWADYQRLSSSARRQREVLLPLAAEKVDLALAAWRGGKGALAEVIAARRERLDTELKAIAVEGERRQKAAQLHYAYDDIPGETE